MVERKSCMHVVSMSAIAKARETHIHKIFTGESPYYYGTKNSEHISFVTGLLILNRCFELRRVAAGTIVSQRYCTFHDSGLVYNLLHHIFRTFGGNRRL